MITKTTMTIASRPPAPPPPSLFGATLQTRDVNFIPSLPPHLCTEQMGVAGPWFRRLPHIRSLPVVGAELQSEYFVPRLCWRSSASATALLLETEVRTIARDDLWMSMCYGRDSVAIHFCWMPDWPAVERVLPEVEAALAPFHLRPHWGKLFAMAPHAVRASYEKLGDFVRLAQRLDPGAKFCNPFLSANVFAPS